MTVLIWNVHDGSNQVGIRNSHKSIPSNTNETKSTHSQNVSLDAITDVKWSRSGREIYSASADSTVAIFDLEMEQMVTRRLRHHESIVNSICVSSSGPEMLASCSDDGYISVRLPLLESLDV